MPAQKINISEIELVEKLISTGGSDTSQKLIDNWLTSMNSQVDLAVDNDIQSLITGCSSFVNNTTTAATGLNSFNNDGGAASYFSFSTPPPLPALNVEPFQVPPPLSDDIKPIFYSSLHNNNNDSSHEPTRLKNARVVMVVVRLLLYKD